MVEVISVWMWIVYAILGAISYITFAVIDLRMSGKFTWRDMLINAGLACIWFVVWFILCGVALGCLVTKRRGEFS